jgi:hypothetical protein
MHAHRDRSHPPLLRSKHCSCCLLQQHLAATAEYWLQLLQHLAATAATRAAAMRHMFAPRFRSAARLKEYAALSY